MAKQSELDDVYMGTAILHSRLSKAKRAQVGAVLVTNHGVTLTGYNGTPSGLANECETPENLTKPEVIHAELNCIMKAAREGVSCIGATVYVTLSPCVQCSAMLIQAGVKRVVYHQLYRDAFGIALLQDAGVVVQSYDQTQKG